MNQQRRASEDRKSREQNKVTHHKQKQQRGGSADTAILRLSKGSSATRTAVQIVDFRM